MLGKLKALKYVGAAVAAAAVIYVGIAGIFTPAATEPYRPEKLPDSATEQERAAVLAEGVVYALEQELDGFLGWMVNDLCFVPNIIDNQSSYQRGVIYATRPASDMIAKTAARIGERDTIDSRLADATSRYFTYGENVWGFWFIYDCEGKYRNGIKNWRAWADSVGTEGRSAGIYNVKSDDVYNIIKYCAALTDYALGNLNDPDIGHFKADNNIYFAKGVCAVVGNVLRALAAVDNSVALRGGTENLDEALKRLNYIEEFNPLYIFAGGNAVGDAMLPNHVAALARHLDVANNRLNDMLASMEK